METMTVPESVYIDGEWFAAHWAVQAVDGGTGELLITVDEPEQALVLRMNAALAAELRRQAGFGQPMRYDCRTTSERLDAIERQQQEHAGRLTALETAMRVDHRTMHATFNEIESRLDALIDQLRAETQGTLAAFAASDKRLDDLEAVALPSGWKTAVERNLDALGEGVAALTERYWPVSTDDEA